MNFFLKRYGLLLSVFITGTAVLVVEILATRILSPYFGNTVYTVSSVIGTVLAALSLGYYIGGIMADSKPSERIFYLIISVSGLSIFLMYYLMRGLLPVIAYSNDLIYGPLIASLFLFLLPSFLLGLLSPYAIKLQQLRFPKVGIGRLSGEIFFWSTLGSIGGSLGAGFFLIPRFGTSQIIIWVAVLLVFLGIAGLVFSNRNNKKIILILIVLLGVSILTANSGVSNNYLYEKEGIYEKIAIFDGIIKGRPTRFFQQDKSSSGAMFLDSDELVFDYTKYFTLYKLTNKAPKNFLVLGGGAYSIPKAINQEEPEANIDVVEIEPSLYDLAKKYFRLKENKQLKNFVADGRRFLQKSDKKYDVIFSDVYYSLYSVPAHFTTKEFFLLSKKKLSKDGVFIANFIGDTRKGETSLIYSAINTFKTAYPNSYFFALTSPQSRQAQNIIFLGVNNDKQINFSDLKTKYSDDPILSNLGTKLIDSNSPGLAKYPVLTDDFAPIESLTGQIIRSSYEKKDIEFNEFRSLDYISTQVDFGPRYLGSEGRKKNQNFLINELEKVGAEVKVQEWTYLTIDKKKVNLKNIVGRFYPSAEKRIILGTHYDTRKYADKDLDNPKSPVTGANDGASGVAVLLEVANYLAETDYLPNVGIDIVFFDGEEGEGDSANINWEPIGSIYFADNLSDYYPDRQPSEVLVIDMVCDKNLNIIKEISSSESAKNQVDSFWKIGQQVAAGVFLDDHRYEIYDDHTPFIKKGIPSFLVIDIDYPPFHTTQDTIDKCSERSLKITGDTLIKYLYSIN